MLLLAGYFECGDREKLEKGAGRLEDGDVPTLIGWIYLPWTGPVFDNRTPEEIFKVYSDNGVEYVVFYYDYKSYFEISDGKGVIVDDTLEEMAWYANLAHEYDLKVLMYTTALQWWGIFPKEDWCQYNGTDYYHKPISYLDHRSPYRDFLCDFCSQLVGRRGYDGIFFETLALKPDSLHDERNIREYNEGRYQSWLEFRYATVHEFAKSVYDAVKDANSDALLVINNNNIFYQMNDKGVPLRDYYALSIERLDDVADVFLLEFCGIDSVEPEAIAAVVDRERDEYGVTSDLWVLYYTVDEKRFEDAKTIAVSKEVGLWNYPTIFLF